MRAVPLPHGFLPGADGDLMDPKQRRIAELARAAQENFERIGMMLAESGGGAPTGAAGGVLSGTYPDPGFASDMATQGELDTHAADTTSVHGIADTSVLATASSVAMAVSTHEADTTSVHGIADTANLIESGDAAGGVLGGTYPNPSFAADMATQAELDTHEADTTAVHGITDTAKLGRASLWAPTNAVAETLPYRNFDTITSALVSGTLRLVGGAVIPANKTVSAITFISGSTALATGSNQWFCLTDQSRVVLATTVDDTSTAWAANTPKTLLLATTIGGGTPGGTYTPTTDKAVYIGVLVVASTMPTLTTRGGLTTNATGVAPIFVGSSTTGLTNPASLPGTAGALTAQGNIPYAYLT